VRAVQHEAQLYGVQFVLQAGDVARYLVYDALVFLLNGQLQEVVQIGGTARQPAPLVGLLLQSGEPAQCCLRRGGVVPEAGFLRLLGEFCYLLFFLG
jgi:hypothetical protein